MIADALSRLPTAVVDHTDLDEEISERNVEFVNKIFVAEKNQGTGDSSKPPSVQNPLRTKSNDLLREQRYDALCREYKTKLDETNSSYLLDGH